MRDAHTTQESMIRAYNLKMNDEKLVNIFGALALAVADDLLAEAQTEAPEAGPAAAAISLLRHEPGMSIDQLRRGLPLSHPGTVRLVDRLAEDGLVMRQTSERDRRAVALSLTQAGESACSKIRAARGESVGRALSALNAKERATFGVLVEKMLSTLVRGEDHCYAVCRLCDETACKECPVSAALLAKG
ncbi:MarR family winged helix-turn-helix transcriptional regulator [Schauerella aestuarii]|uniref:MarR family winged helix-turn-helix transcriptional regulator n=1 Tax=Schauerella aestuarii TaxID=2511204 RepID=UPI00136FD7A9|nr:MarR family transcriptional regulator [Achromobacter aestuarii]MYZ43334.1 MarR family transcriptional regulator [Achromobacter aestuarii]